MKPRPIVQNQDLLFKSRLSEQLNPEHELLRLAKAIEWNQLEMEFASLFSAEPDIHLFPSALLAD